MFAWGDVEWSCAWGQSGSTGISRHCGDLFGCRKFEWEIWRKMVENDGGWMRKRLSDRNPGERRLYPKLRTWWKKSEVKNANYDEKLQEIGQKLRSLDDRRSGLNIEFRSLSLQADTRAKLELLRNESKSKTQEISSLSVLHWLIILSWKSDRFVFSMDHNSSRYRKLVGKDIKGPSIDKELERAMRW